MTHIDDDGGYHAGEPSDPDPNDFHVGRLSPRDVVTLIEAQWRQFWRVCYGPDRDPRAAPIELERLIRLATSVPRTGDGAKGGWYAQMMAGLGHLERFVLHEDRRDLDTGIALLLAVIGRLPVDTPKRELAAAELANALYLRAEFDGDGESLEMSIAAGHRAMETFNGREPNTWLMLHQCQAQAYERRWRREGNGPDLDRAIACWEVLLDAESSEPTARWEAKHCGALLLERAKLTLDPTDSAAAIILLGRATRGLEDDPEAWPQWLDLAQAHHVRWLLTQQPSSLEAAGGCLDRALGSGQLDEQEALRLHLELLVVALAPVEVGRRRWLPRSGLAKVTDRAREALAATREPDTAQRDVLLRLLDWVGEPARDRTARVDRAGLRRLLQRARGLCGLPRSPVTTRGRVCRAWARPAHPDR